MVVLKGCTKGYDEKVLKHLKSIELCMLNDFIAFCDEHDLNYIIFAGSAIGTVRHKGFIPWDDEIDIAMLREDYEKFLKFFEEYGNHDKYELVNWHTQFDIDEDLYNYMTFISLKNTYLFPNYHLGIYLDITVLDCVPNSKFKRFFFTKHMQLNSISTAVFRDTYGSENRQRIGHFIRFFFKIFHITPNFMAKLFTKQILKAETGNPTHVTDVSFYYNKFFPKEYFKDIIELKFEHLTVKIPREYDNFLRIIYGDYMKLPPEEDRVDHNGYCIDFGEYK